MNIELLNQVVLASSDSSEGDPRILGLLLFLSGFVYYGLIYLRYRNTDKRHLHESETEARMLNVQAFDQHIEHKKGVKHSKMKGANNHEVRARSDAALAGVVPKAVGGVIKQLRH
jgi:hypothetical protein